MNLKNRIRLLLLGAILICFGRCLFNDFVDWDDSRLIYLNDNIAHPTVAHLMAHWWPWSPSNSHMYNPLVYTTWWVLAQGAQLETPDVLGAKLNPMVFHATNLAVHWVTVCVVFEILLTLGLPTWPAAAGALVFAIHPLQTESVVWATAMKDLLCGLFSVLCIWRYLIAARLGGARPGGAIAKRNYWIATIFFVAALLSKPSAVVVPGMVGAIDLIFLRTPWRRVARWTGPWFVLAAGTAVLAKSVQLLEGIKAGPVLVRPLIALDALAFYLYKLLIPIRLSIDYGRSPTAVMNDPSFHHPLRWTWMFPVAAALLIWASKRRDVAAAGLIFFLGVLPVLGLTTFVYQYWSTVADRYVYVSMLGVAWGVAMILRRFHGRAAVGVFAAVAMMLASLSFVQAGIWNNTATVLGNAIELNHTRGLHYIFYGQYEDKLAAASFKRADDAQKNGDPPAARELVNEGKNYMERAIEIYKQGKDLDLKNPKFLDALSTDYVRLGRIDEAIAAVKEWIGMQPSYEEGSREKPGRLEYMLGELYLRKGELEDALEWLEKSEALRADPVTEEQLDAVRRRDEKKADGAGSGNPSSRPTDGG
jgi:hypothetical protein